MACTSVPIGGRNKINPFRVSVGRAGKQVNLGAFATAEEAALTYARTPEARVEMAKPVRLTADEAAARAAAEGLTLEPSSNESGYKLVTMVKQTGRFRAETMMGVGKKVHLGIFSTAEEAALAVARVIARTTAPTTAPLSAAAKRAAPLPKPRPAKEPRNTLAPRPINSVTQPPALALGATVAAAPAPIIFKDKLALLKRELDIKPAIPAIPAIAEANELLGITPGDGDSLGAQLDMVLAAISR